MADEERVIREREIVRDREDGGNSAFVMLAFIIVLIIVGFLVWYFVAARGNSNTNDANDAGLNVNVDLPGGDNGDNTGQQNSGY